MTKTLKIPKKIAGVKLPKKVRRKAKKAINMGASPIVREIAAAAIGAAAAAGNGGESGRPRIAGRARIHIDGGKVGEAFRSAAIDGLRRFLEGFEEGLRKAGGGQDDPQPEPRAKPKDAKKAKARKSRRPSAKPASRAPGA